VAFSPSTDGIPFLDLLIVLAERKRTILTVTLATVVLAVGLAFILPPSYTATVTLLTPQQNTSLSATLASQLGSVAGMAALAGGSGLLRNPNDVYVAMLTSRTVEDAMVQRYGLMSEYNKHFPTDARLAFERHAKVAANVKDGMIHISVEDRDPVRAATLANGYVEQFRNLSEHLAITEAAQRRLFFQRELEDAKNNLENSEEALKETEQKTGVIQLDSQARALIEAAASLRAQITAKQVQIEAMQTYATGENAQLIQAQSELQSLRAQMAKLGGSDNGSELIVPKGKVTEAGVEYIRKFRDVKYYETIFEILARQFEAAKLDEARQGAMIQVVDVAVPPDRRSFPKRGRFAVLGFVVGLVMGIGLALSAVGLDYLRSQEASNTRLILLRRTLSWRSRSAS
jgi:uncharacterized protein involved in exopolysaccharide biosynthesis